MVVLRFTLPNERLPVLRLSVGVPAFSCRAKPLATVPAVAVRVAVWFEVTAETVAVNPAVVAPEGTLTEAGTLAEALLLASATVNPPEGAAAVKVTAQASVPAPVIDAFVQERVFSDPAGDWPVPVRLITAVPLVEALLLMVREPVTAPAVVGLNLT